jgi:light-regulated signal transduction histidine kinase (bacteriophytochrome)
VDLKRSHVELEEIAYAASHDLQEPLRKIQVFSNMLLVQQHDDIGAGNRESLKRINTLANRMQLLISDLFSLTSLTKIDEVKKSVDLNKVVNFLMIDLEEKITEKNALVVVENLPEIQGYENQLKLLFNALFDNALKFTRYNVQPVIRITGTTVTGAELKEVNPNLKNRKYHQISFTDNGIGFDNVYMNKMFRLFQRLHTQNSEYVGKGIGLAICQRVVTNHEGYVVADGKSDEGATFKLYFPAD